MEQATTRIREIESGHLRTRRHRQRRIAVFVSATLCIGLLLVQLAREASAHEALHHAARATVSGLAQDPADRILVNAISQYSQIYHDHPLTLGARRAKEAGLDGIELHAANGYLFTQFLSSGINNRRDHYGGSLRNRARFLLEVIAAIRAEVGLDFHLQVKLSGVDHNNILPWEGRGNTLADTVQVARWWQPGRPDAPVQEDVATGEHRRSTW